MTTVTREAMTSEPATFSAEVLLAAMAAFEFEDDDDLLDTCGPLWRPEQDDVDNLYLLPV